jgi:hypothetical protein
VVFGGLSDGPTLDHISRLIGDHRVSTRTVSTDREGKRNETRGFEWRPRLAPSQLRELRRGWALLLYHHRPPRALRAPIAAKRWRMRHVVQPAAIPASAPVVSMPATTRPAVIWPEVRPHVVRVEEAPTTSSHAAANGGSAEAQE